MYLDAALVERWIGFLSSDCWMSVCVRADVCPQAVQTTVGVGVINAEKAGGETDGDVETHNFYKPFTQTPCRTYATTAAFTLHDSSDPILTLSCQVAQIGSVTRTCRQGGKKAHEIRYCQVRFRSPSYVEINQIWIRSASASVV